MRYYPLLLDLHGTHCLIVGFGKVGQRKLATLLKANPAQVTVLDTFSIEEVEDADMLQLLNNPFVTYSQRSFEASDVAGKTLVFASTGSRTVNKQVSDACAAHNILCNVIDDPSSGTFTVPAHIEKGDLLITLSTGGASPALSRKIKKELEKQVGDKYAPVVTLMGRIRPLILELANDTEQNTTVFRNLVSSDIATAIQKKDQIAAESILRSILPETLHSNIGALLHELI
ncbi:bifunctional precorrin-2 dehydrogenase/sirohydrochlorin ferrochelatase [Halodesulfovibrio sp.]|jgi:precorrin-2 dehydrogenase/sirohydrochlorin ferrochelatase|uniref:precorrin-2 dehydrogenase/sirohydrochlorin ferrochelatase family protein n=1 Tax=Halodesulfovibrio sp. TaxID=1912772 RepID=UPI0025CF6A9A|nr:bifunctional precorrin-2 dehydrogenase/sirohydrochlorin ferrochelatase [Halodesulfovibrio sp.]MCT4627467.1 bifunctional precorrin-2 dehydrogenase/sirohydrochlorin ferrochelatase [Halodesulfovibrio sp.]